MSAFILIKKILNTYYFLFILSYFFLPAFLFAFLKKIDAEFVKWPLKPLQHKIIVDVRTINYADIGNGSLPIDLSVYGSSGSWSAFFDFMKDTVLL